MLSFALYVGNTPMKLELVEPESETEIYSINNISGNLSIKGSMQKKISEGVVKVPSKSLRITYAEDKKETS